MHKFMFKGEAKAVDYQSQDHQFAVPVKKINDDHSLKKFLSSPSSMDLAMFIVECQKAVKSSRMTETEVPEKMNAFMAYFEKLDQWLTDVPPIDQPMRFGNKAFRTWMDKIRESAVQDITTIALAANPEFKNIENAAVELGVYLFESFGSYERIDYGTGHELNFLVFLYCLCKLGIFKYDDYKPLINRVFQRYLLLMRRLQTYYYLEPAGSHGVWGLDDY